MVCGHASSSNAIVTPLQTIAKLTFPSYKGDKIFITCVDEFEQRGDDAIEWLVDLAKIEAAGPNVGTRGERLVLPISSGVPVLPSQSVEIVTRTQEAFRCERFLISNVGTLGGAADWVVNDIRIGGRSQLQSDDVPGGVFSVNAFNSFLSFETAMGSMDIAVNVTYVGANEGGAPFFASMVGKLLHEAKPEYVRVGHAAAAHVSPGFALVSHALPAGSRRHDDHAITIYVPFVDRATIDVAVDAVLTSGIPTEAVHTMIANMLGARHELVHAVYIALVEQRANELVMKERIAAHGESLGPLDQQTVRTP